MREINSPLLDGLEAKKLLIAEKEKARSKDSIIIAQGMAIGNMERAQKVTSDNLWHSEARNENCMSNVTILMADNKKLERRLRTYKTIAIVTSCIIVAAGGTTYLIVK